MGAPDAEISRAGQLRAREAEPAGRINRLNDPGESLICLSFRAAA
jgi:hypothetical protein